MVMYTDADVIRVIRENPRLFIRLLRQDEELLDEFRRVVLSDELLAMPAQLTDVQSTQNSMLETQAAMLEDLAGLRRTQNSMLETQAAMLEDLAGLRRTQNSMLETQAAMLEGLAGLRQTQNSLLETQAAMLEDLAGLRQTQNSLLKTQNSMLRRLDNIEAHNGRLSHDFRNFRGNYAETAAVKNATDIALLLNEARDLGLDETAVRVLSGDDLRALARGYGADMLSAIPLDDRRSYYKADLVIEAVRPSGSVCYIAVQASYTCDSRDTDSAVSNAELLMKFTGREAWAAVAGVRVDRRIQPLIDGGEVFWYSVDEDELDPIEPS